MKKLIPFVMLLFVAPMAQAQQREKPGEPNEQSKVTREYDENGNLIRFDSTYVKSWSSDSTMTMSPEDVEQLQKQMQEMFSGAFGDDADNFFGDPFPGSAKDFFNQPGDSTLTMPGFQNAFPDLEEMHQRMMQHFSQFFQRDTAQIKYDTIPGDLRFDFFGNPREFEEIRKEFEQHFEQFRDEQKQSGQERSNAPGAI
ncbi:hypothetical protein [Mangrovibacterium marinum]|uniref:Uncharacterized protein n=1 Tax=Mangrovibacterium marinum TaxID=1639118 RepID=A0A2T5C5T0_9BACT|nr:hypothetical protein [Mangrovibacterium marinum]PTN10274.1 hypothetical protein C8N47_102259 [Mangrovibacterium marinum]